MPDNTTNKDRLKEITASIEDGIKDLFQSEKYMQYLRTMSRFHRYSVNNTMLIYMQKPDATLVAGFNKWKDQFSRNVMKGERGIKIIAPTPFKKKIEQEKLDPDTRLPMLDADGKIITEEKTVQIPMYIPRHRHVRNTKQKLHDGHKRNQNNEIVGCHLHHGISRISTSQGAPHKHHCRAGSSPQQHSACQIFLGKVGRNQSLEHHIEK